MQNLNKISYDAHKFNFEHLELLKSKQRGNYTRVWIHEFQRLSPLMHYHAYPTVLCILCSMLNAISHGKEKWEKGDGERKKSEEVDSFHLKIIAGGHRRRVTERRFDREDIRHKKKVILNLSRAHRDGGKSDVVEEKKKESQADRKVCWFHFFFLHFSRPKISFEPLLLLPHHDWFDDER